MSEQAIIEAVRRRVMPKKPKHVHKFQRTGTGALSRCRCGKSSKDKRHAV